MWHTQPVPATSQSPSQGFRKGNQVDSSPAHDPSAFFIHFPPPFFFQSQKPSVLPLYIWRQNSHTNTIRRDFLGNVFNSLFSHIQLCLLPYATTAL